MIIYIAIYFILLIGSFTGLKPQTLGLYLFFLIILLGLRSSEIGADTERYIDYYNYVDLGVGHMEIGWNVLSILCKKIGLSAYLFNLLIALLTLLFFGYGIRRQESKRVYGNALFLLYSLGFYFLMFNGMRQLFAGSIVFLAFQMLFEKHRKWKALLLILVASLFHTSALITLPVLILPNVKLTTQKVIIALVISFIIGLFLNESMLALIAGKYAHDVTTFGMRDSFAYALTVGLFTNALFIWMFSLSNDIFKNNLWVKVFFLSIIVMNLLINLVIGPRIVYFFSVAQIIAISLFLAEAKSNIYMVICHVYALLTFIRFMIGEYYSKEGSLIPYQMVEFSLL